MPSQRNTELERGWGGEEVAVCDFCKKTIKTIFYDSKTIYGLWAIICHACYLEYGTGLGLGRGQAYDKQTLKRLGG